MRAMNAQEYQGLR